jgi:hypothetical protein
MKRILRVVSWVSEVPAWANRHKVWAGIVITLALLAFVIFVPRLPIIGPRTGREAESDFRGHLIQLLGGIVLIAGAYFTGRTFALNREGQITERFTRAVEQLANKTSAGIAKVGEKGGRRDFHSFRHTFARIALEGGRRMDWVQRQLGHSTIVLTVDLYGSWERKAEKEEARGLPKGSFSP